eukprot:Colp12_sorted_trinity150504_noHs@4281
MTHHILLDRMLFRSHGKEDSLLRKYGANIYRFNGDVRDFQLEPAVVELQKNWEGKTGRKDKNLESAKIVCVSKHFCGVATDLALHQVINSIACNKGVGVCMATCCHALCLHQDYVGKDWLARHGIDPDEFGWIVKMSSWATLKIESEDKDLSFDISNVSEKNSEKRGTIIEERDGPATKEDVVMSRSSRRALGYLCKRFLDYGRIDFLRQNGLAGAALVKYTKSSVEDALIVCL